VGRPPLLAQEEQAREVGPLMGFLVQAAGALPALVMGARAPRAWAAQQPVVVALQATALCTLQTAAAGAPQGGPEPQVAVVVATTAAGQAGPAIQISLAAAAGRAG